MVASMIFCVRSICALAGEAELRHIGVRPGVVADHHAGVAQLRTTPGDCLTFSLITKNVARVQRLELVQDLPRERPGAVVERQRHAALAVGRRDALHRRAVQFPEGPVALDLGRLLHGARRVRGELWGQAAGLSTGGRPGAYRMAVGGRLVTPAAEGEDEARDDCAGDEQCNGGRQQPAPRVGAHPTPSGVV
jgi:hypothetical protein